MEELDGFSVVHTSQCNEITVIASNRKAIIKKKGTCSNSCHDKGCALQWTWNPRCLINVSSPVADSLKPALPTDTNIQGTDWVAFKELELSYHDGRHSN